MTDLRYPIGRFSYPDTVTDQLRQHWIGRIAGTPAALRAAVAGLSPEQLDTPYRPGGWTVRQVVHHLPDGHVNAYVRIRLALTEAEPPIKPYAEDRWAQLHDALVAPPEVSLTLLEALHHRWVLLLRSLGPAEFARTCWHPERGAAITVDFLTALYAWHGDHHVAHITSLRERMGW